jgi:hypothetical protein
MHLFKMPMIPLLLTLLSSLGAPLTAIAQAGDCCQPGASCCSQGSPCCAGHKH